MSKSSVCINRGTDHLPFVVYDLTPKQEYLDTATFSERKQFGRLDVGAYEFKGNAGFPVFTETAVAFYPNPVVGNMLYFNTLETTSFSISSLDGAIVYAGILEGGKCLLTDVPSGLYIILLKNVRSLILVE